MRIILLTFAHALIFSTLCYFVATSQAEQIQSSIYDDVVAHLSQQASELQIANIRVSVSGRAVTLITDAGSLPLLESTMMSVQHLPGVISVIPACSETPDKRGTPIDHLKLVRLAGLRSNVCGVLSKSYKTGLF